jgi:hypothetical protein
MKETKKDYSIISIRIDTDFLKEVKQLAELDNRTFSNYVVNILKKNLK